MGTPPPARRTKPYVCPAFPRRSPRAHNPATGAANNLARSHPNRERAVVLKNLSIPGSRLTAAALLATGLLAAAGCQAPPVQDAPTPAVQISGAQTVALHTLAWRAPTTSATSPASTRRTAPPTARSSRASSTARTRSTSTTQTLRPSRASASRRSSTCGRRPKSTNTPTAFLPVRPTSTSTSSVAAPPLPTRTRRSRSPRPRTPPSCSRM